MIFRRNNKGNGPVIVNEGRSLNGIDVLGFFTAEHGVGEAARVLTATLQSAGVPVSIIDYTDTQSRREHSFDCEPVNSRTSSASSNIVNSTGFPMLIGPRSFESSNAKIPRISSST